MAAPKIAHETTHRVTIKFDTEPPRQLQDEMRSKGWRYSRNMGCWWTRDTPEAREQSLKFAQTVTATPAVTPCVHCRGTRRNPDKPDYCDTCDRLAAKVGL